MMMVGSFERLVILLRFAILLLSLGCFDARSSNPAVSYNQRSFRINGKPVLLLSGSIHYTRIPPSDWDTVLRMAKEELGLNAIQTYVFWNQHEPRRVMDETQQEHEQNWEGYGNLVRFLELAASHDLYVVLRIGPYICGEYYFGGLPLWLRTVEDEKGNSIECFRCNDPLWKREIQRWTAIVTNKVRPYFLTNDNPRGNIILLQIENEYSQNDDYARWTVEMAQNLTTEVPWEMCHSVPACTQINNENHSNNSTQVICAINGFWMEKGGEGQQPGPEFFEYLWNDTSAATYNQPAVWTEDQGWFDKWKYGQRIRWTSDQLYGIARFFAFGGSYHNFYMLTGGNNYGLKAGGDATTAYAPDTVIDNLLLRHEPRFSIYRNFFSVLRAYETELLRHPPAKTVLLEPKGIEAHEYGSFVFLSNRNENDKDSVLISYNQRSYYLTNHSVVLIDASSSAEGVVLFNTSSTIAMELDPHSAKDDKDPDTSQSTTVSISNWSYFHEKVGYGAIQLPYAESPEQLNITNNDSDYLWYTLWTDQQIDRTDILVSQYGYDGIVYVYLDGLLLPSSNKQHNGGFDDQLNQWTPKQQVRRRVLRYPGTRLHYDDSQEDNDSHRLDILSVAMGLFNGGVGPESQKGVRNLTISNITHTKFQTQWKLLGEALQIYTEEGSRKVSWKSVVSNSTPRFFPTNDDSLVWLQGTFDLPIEYHASAGKAQPNQTALVANLTGLYKGVAYVNGFCIGRYWLAAGVCDGNNNGCAPPFHGPHCYIHWKGCGQPTQSLYHIPFEVLKPRRNLLTVFEETAAQARNLTLVGLTILHDHPTLN